MLRSVLLAGLVGALTLATMPAPAASVQLPCDGFAFTPHVGWTCTRPDGLLELYTAEGRRVGLSHGPDGLPAPAAAGYAPDPPVCAEDLAAESYAVVVYAHPADVPDNFTGRADEIRDAVGVANAAVLASARARGAHVELKAECDASGRVRVHHATLPTPAAQAHFVSIASDLQAQGFDRTSVRYLVYYDDPDHHIPYGGQGNLCDDDRLAVHNENNGLGPGCGWCPGCPMFGVDYGFFSWWIGLHELGHTQGVVPITSPNTSGAHHCNDGEDVMCYADGGPRSNYRVVCPERVWDCGHDDYFDPAPAAGSYLATHWNVGSPLHRFVRWGDGTLAPQAHELRCRLLDGSTERECRLFATDDSPRITYTLAWGDGNTTTFAPRPPATPVVARHVYADGAHVVLTLTATDSTGRTATRTLDTALAVPNAPPVVSRPICEPEPAFLDETIRCFAYATDDSTGVRYELRADGWTIPIPYAGWAAPATPREGCCISSAGPHTFVLELRAFDDETPSLASAPAHATLTVHDNHRPKLAGLACGPYAVRANDPLTCTFHGVDADGDPLAFFVDWGDGTIERVPATGRVPPLQEVSASHAWSTVNASYTVRIVAEDDFTPTARSAEWSFDVKIHWNVPPLVLDEDCSNRAPREGETLSCSFRAIDRDGTSLWHAIHWGEGDWIDLGWHAPGTTVQAAHAYTTSGSRRVLAYAYDSVSEHGALADVRVDVLPALPCDVFRAGQLVAGARGADVPIVASSGAIEVPAECRGKTWRLNLTPLVAAGPAPVGAACWTRADGTSLCDTAPEGTVPATATSVRVVLHEGAAVLWRLVISG